MKVLRIHLNPNGEHFIYVGLGAPADSVNFNMAAWWVAVRRDNAVIAQGAFIPLSSIHHMLLDELAEVPPVNLYTILGGKPN